MVVSDVAYDDDDDDDAAIVTVLLMVVQISGLSKVLGSSLAVFSTLPKSVIVLILILIGTTFTTFTSNVATTTILLPITQELVRPPTHLRLTLVHSSYQSRVAQWRNG